MSEERLRPAKPERGGKSVFGPKLPWKWIIGGTAIVSAVIIGYALQQENKAETLRGHILGAWERHVKAPSERVTAFREKIEGWVIDAAGGAPERHVDPRLRIAGLHSGRGVYLRLRAADATSPEKIEEGAKAMDQDAITRCLGVAPASLRGLYERGEFLKPEWLQSVREANGVMRLRVLDDELARHAERDLPVLLDLARADWFLLVLQRGENRRDAPVDVFLWDLRRDELLLSGRTQADGILIPARIGSAGAGAQGAPRIDSGGANDCAIASQIKAMTGETPVTFGSQIEAQEPAAPAAPAEGATPEAAPAPAQGSGDRGEQAAATPPPRAP